MTGAYPEFVHEATEEICQREPLAARTRLAMLRLEKDVHREGWDSRASWPTIIRFERHRERHFVKARVSDPMSTALRLACEHHTDGDVGEALALLAWVAEQGRDAFTEFGVPLNEDTMHSHEGPGWEFYGYAFRQEAWTLPSVPYERGEDGKVRIPGELAETIHEKRIHQHPDRVECRMIHLAARDGLMWSLIRRRRMPPVECVVTRPEGMFEHAGLVVNALSRMTNAAAGNPVPVARLSGEVLSKD